ncbi:hypothetical protein [Streptomyces sp. S1]|uniref:hypothetical protein n=1 Tax=Streptomyces sp. S1 TaxID=718288 RepID=UPI0013CF3140|nr:hypothetical protein [Streptomyces sp. S1]
MKVIVDTQVISYAIKGARKEPLPSEFSITSTIAQEILRVRDISKGNARYFTPPPQGLLPEQRDKYFSGRAIHGTGHPKDRPLFKNSTDRVVMDFNNEYPSLVEYGHAGISWLIKTGNRKVYEESIGHLPKGERKKLVRNFEFLADHKADCIPVSTEIVSGAFSLLRRATDDGVTLKSDFRNSLNDMLILATARCEGADIRTDDKLLAQFAKESGLSKVTDQGELYELSFPVPDRGRQRASRESKGYRNTGWRFAIHRAP